MFRGAIVALLVSLASGCGPGPDAVGPDVDLSLLSPDGGSAGPPRPISFAAPLFEGQSWSDIGTVAAADVDKDGRLDLITAGISGVEVTLALAGGGWAVPIDQPLPWGFMLRWASAQVLDANEDGKLDIAAVQPLDNSVVVLIGAGDGTFHRMEPMAVGKLPGRMVAADFNRDGHVDLATVDVSSDQVSVLIGHGDGSFRPAAHYPLGRSPFHLAAADLDGDGVVDLVTANRDTLDVSVLHGVGDGTFAITGHITTPHSPISVAVSDLDRDGKPELVLGTGGSVMVLRASKGSFVSAGTYVLAGSAVAIALGDFNGDRQIDCAATVDTGFFPLGKGAVVILNGDGQGGFDAPSAPVLDMVWSVDALCTADVDGDGALDVLASTERGFTYVLSNDGKGQFQARPFPAPASYWLDPAADFDGDGRIDLLSVSSDESQENRSIGTWMGDGNRAGGGPRFRMAQGSQLTGDPWFTVGDFDNDHHPDVVSLAALPRMGSFLAGTGDGRLRPPHPIGVTVAASSAGIPGDLDGDGNLDLIVRHDKSMQALRGSGRGNFQLADTVPLTESEFDERARPLLVDWNEDGHLDVIVLNRKARSISLLVGRGDGTFHPPADVPLPFAPNFMDRADFNGDGHPDLAISEAELGDNLHVYFGGGGGFLAGPVTGRMNDTSFVAAADLNGDGRADVALTTADGVAVYEGLGDGSFKPPMYLNKESEGVQMRALDVDGDGQLDLVGSGARMLLFFMNQSR